MQKSHPVNDLQWDSEFKTLMQLILALIKSYTKTISQQIRTTELTKM